MKYNKIALAVITSLLIPLSSTNATIYKSIVHKNSYEYKASTFILGVEIGVNTAAENVDTKQTSSNDITKSTLSLDAENGHLIEISTDVINKEQDGRSLTGRWISSQPISFLANTKNSAIFYAPSYDGSYYVDLELSDGLYTKIYKGVNISSELWTVGSTIISEWQTESIIQDWSPSTGTIYENETFEQNKIINQSRTKQNIEERTSTGETRDIGDLVTETRDNFIEVRTENGTMAFWESTDPKVVTPWAVTETFVNWTPDASGVYETDTVNQYREVKKERTIQNQEVRPINGSIRTVGGVISDTTLITEYRDVQGQLEYWVNSGVSNCTEWSLDRYDVWLPDASGIDRSETIEQTRTKYEDRSCTGEQVRPATGATRSAESEQEFRSEVETQTVDGTKIDLNDWSSTDASGEWSVSSDGSYAYQAINGAPTIFESKASNFGTTSIKGRMRVRAGAGDNDWIGMAVGRQDSNNYHLWSWKLGGGATEMEGHNFAKVTNHSAINWAMDLSKAGYQVLDVEHGTQFGWVHGVYYSFEIKYTPTNVQIYVDGLKVIDANGTFPDGKIGFFNYSQGQVEYYKVTDTPLN